MRRTNHAERGNIFTFLFGAVAVVGVITAATMQLVSGPIKTATRVNNKNTAESQMMAAGRILIIDAATQSNDGDTDSDGSVEPRGFATVASGGITGGGSIPTSVGATRTDPWGTLYGYCVWDDGTTYTGYTGSLAGALTTSSPVPTVIAVVSAGPNKTFETTCVAYASGATTGDAATTGVVKASGSDDIVMKWTYAEAIAASAGLWAIKAGAPATATIGKSLEITDPGNSNTVTASINRSTGIGDFLGITTDLITAKTGGDIQIDGNVGIGTTAPTSKLHIANGTTYDPAANQLAALILEGNYGGGLLLKDGTKHAGIWTTDFGETLHFKTGGTTSMGGTGSLIIKESGNVGIGVVTPSSKLHIASTGDVYTSIQSTDNTGKAGVKFLGAGDRGSIYADGLYHIYIEPNAQYGQANIIMNPKNGTTMNVGIGTTAPLSELHIASTGTNTTLGQLDTSLRLQTSTATSNAGSEILFQGYGGTDSENIYAAISAPVISNTSGASGEIVFSTKATHPAAISERMRIKRDGNIGIGTAAPTSLLHVSKTQTDTSGFPASVVFSTSLQPSASSSATHIGTSFGTNYASSNANTSGLRNIAAEISPSTGSGSLNSVFGIYNRVYDTVVGHTTTTMYGSRNEVFTYGTNNSMFGDYNTATAYNDATSTLLYGSYNSANSANAAVVTNSIYGSYDAATTTSTTSTGISNIIGSRSVATHSGSQTATVLYGVMGEARATTANSTTTTVMGGNFTGERQNNAPVSNVYGTYAYANNNASSTTGTLTNIFGSYVSGRNSAASTVSNLYSNYLYTTNSSTGTVGQMFGQYNYVENAASGAITTAMTGDYALARTYNTSGTVPYVRGARTIAQNYGTGTVSYLQGAIIEAATYTASTTTSIVGLTISTANTGGGTATSIVGAQIDLGSTSTATNYYGLKVEDEGTANSGWYSIYVGNSSGTGTKSFFGGFIGIGSGKTAPAYDIDSAGSIRTTSVILTSDARLKKNVETLDDALNKIVGLRGVSYEWKKPVNADQQKEQIGLIAQEVEKIYPQVVMTDKDGMMSVNYPALIAPVIEAVKSLYQKLLNLMDIVKTLSDRIAELEAQNKALEIRLEKIEKQYSAQ